jgi:NAD(P)-dependent dehydrogenase (short-subunit alcohol dehydrogenase family)
VDVSLEGKVALVTGAGPNIGSGISLALARYGARVACNDRHAEAAAASVRRIERNGGTAIAIPGDVTSEGDVSGYVQRVLDTWGKIDILVNNASLLGGRGVLDETTEDFTRAVMVAALGNFLNTRYVARSMCERGVRGSIVCISSSNGWSGSPGVIAYAFHKGGVNNFVRLAVLRLRPAHHGLRPGRGRGRAGQELRPLPGSRLRAGRPAARDRPGPGGRASALSRRRPRPGGSHWGLCRR